MQDKIILALDFSNFAEVDRIINLLPDLKWVKVGMQLYFSEGNSIITYLKSKNLKIFLDLKLHDIPNTVKQAITNLNKLEVDLLTVHASGGFNMLKAAKEAGQIPLAAVTCLTSISPETLNNQLMVNIGLEEYVLALATLAKDAGIKHLVCSPLELDIICKNFGNDFTIITPGIRKTLVKNDQARVMTPSDALKRGANFLVIGREITGSLDPKAAFYSLGDA